ncbi:Transcription initiation factor TFIID subunit 12 [Grifola frondosa]|uniref:TBP-associated factor 12 n=1 Tax=Grifola frondosa TaxID=5627 RepID=A0A1C7M181_GRIFR|nr:Transcription initiation factor TFIID subunit 12 [Grifola frondosa]
MTSTPATAATPSSNTANIITALGNAFKSQTGDPMSGDRIAQLLLQNMSQLGELAKQGKLNQAQILQLREYADKHKNGPAQPAPVVANTSAFKTSSQTPLLRPIQWAPGQQGRPSLTGGFPSGRVSGTPVQVLKGTEDTSMLAMDDNRTRRKNTPGDQSMRRSIQDLVSSIDPNVRIEPDVEDLLLDIADEFIDSVTNFGCRLAKHRGGDTLEVKDLQLHLERNHNIRIPGFASDEARISLSSTAIAPAAPAATTTKKGAQGTHMTLRSHRLAQVQVAKKEAKLM